MLRTKKYLILAIMLTSVPGVRAGGKGQAPPEAEPPVAIIIGPRQADGTPFWQGCCAKTGGGNIKVAQPEPNTMVVTMTGAAAAGLPLCRDSIAGYVFQLNQCFDVVVNDPKVRAIKLTLDGQVVGVLRSRCTCCGRGGSAEISAPAHASIQCGNGEILGITIPPRMVCCGQHLTVNDHEGPVCLPIVPGSYTLQQMFGITAGMRPGCPLCKPASADFAPGNCLKEDQWCKDPFRGVDKKEFGFQITIKASPCDDVPGKGGKDGKDVEPAHHTEKKPARVISKVTPIGPTTRKGDWLPD